MPSCHVCRSSHRLIGQVQDQQPASEVTGLGKVSNQLCAAHVSDVQSVTSHMSVGIPAQGTTTVSKPNVSSKHGHVHPGTATAPTADASSGGGGRPESPEPRGVVRHERQQTGIPLIPADSAPVEPMQPARRQGQTHGVHFVSVPPGYGGKWAMEPGPYPSSTMTSSSVTPEVHALQQRMLNMENALVRIMHHPEGQAHAAPVPEPTISDTD